MLGPPAPRVASGDGDDLGSGPPLSRCREVPARPGSLRRGVRPWWHPAPSLRGGARRARAARFGGAARARPIFGRRPRARVRPGTTADRGPGAAPDRRRRVGSAGGRPAAAHQGPQLLPPRRLRRPADLRRRRRPAAPAGDLLRLRAADARAARPRRCRRRPWPASTLSGAPTAPCWFWRTICGCPPEPATPSPFAKRSSRRSTPRRARVRSDSYAGQARRRDPRRRSRRPRRPGGGDRLRRARQRRLVRAPSARPRAGDTGGDARRAGGRRAAASSPATTATAGSSTSSTAASTRTASAPRTGPDRPRRAAAASAGVRPPALRQRLRHRPRRRQARPRLHREHGPLLPRRGAAAALGAQLRPLRRSAGARRRWDGSTSW